LIEVLLQIADDDPAGRGIVGVDADVEILVVIQDAHLGPLAGRLPLLRLVLEKARRHWCVAPNGLIERPVEGDGVWIRTASSRRSLRSAA